jgi:hypothetical protein
VPPSRPIPESPTPPNGARRSRTKKQFTQTVPAVSARATRWAPLALEPFQVVLGIIARPEGVDRPRVGTPGSLGCLEAGPGRSARPIPKQRPKLFGT